MFVGFYQQTYHISLSVLVNHGEPPESSHLGRRPKEFFHRRLWCHLNCCGAFGDWDDIYGDGCSKYLGLMDPQFGLAQLVQTPITITDSYLVGIPTPLKRISQLGVFFPIYGKIKNVPDHQPAMVYGGYIYTYYGLQTNKHTWGAPLCVFDGCE